MGYNTRKRKKLTQKEEYGLTNRPLSISNDNKNGLSKLLKRGIGYEWKTKA